MFEFLALSDLKARSLAVVAAVCAALVFGSPARAAEDDDEGPAAQPGPTMQLHPCPTLTRDFPYWRGAYEKTPGPFLCQQPDVTDLVVVCNRWPDCSDLRQFCLDSIRLSGAKTEHEKALAVWQWMRRVKTMTNGQPPMDPFNPDRGGGRANCPIKVLNVYSAHFCSGLGRVHSLMWRALGYHGEKVSRATHGMAGLFYKDYDDVERCHLFDCNFGGFTMDRAQKRVLTPDEFSTDVFMWMHIWYFNEPWPMPTHRVELSMRKGEGLKRIWGNWGKPFHNNVGSEETDRQFRQPSEKGPYPITYGNGLWTYTPDLSSAEWVQGLAEPASGMVAGKLQPAAAGQPGTAVWHFRTPYLTVESEIEMKAFRKSDGDKLKLHLSLDGGKTWKECWSAPAGETGAKTFTAKLDQKFEVSTDKKTRIPKDFHAPFGRYAFRLKLELVAAGAPEDCRVEGITFKTTVHNSIRALPQLWPGSNKITVRGKLAKGAAVKVTYVWDDPKGKDRKNVTIAEELPYSYEIIAAGKKWEDCVCKDFIIETIPATGKGSRTEVKEEPSEIEKLPPIPSADETRCRWGRPEKGKMSIDECVKIVESGDKRRIQAAMVWIAELADPKGFEAAKKVAFDKQLCAESKGLKTDANLAMYKADREKARPVLKEIMADVKNSPWRGGDDMKSAGGAWISGACMIGQMAAEAGWKDYVPVMCQVLNSEYCNNMVSRMSILRSMYELVEPGDQVAIEAVRKCLKLDEAYMLPEAALVAGKLGDKGSIPRMRDLLYHPFLVVRRSAAVALGMLGDAESAPKIREYLFTLPKRELLDNVKYGTEVCMDESMRAAAARGLGLMKDKGSLPDLEKALANEPAEWVRDAIAEAIKAIKGT